MASVSGFRWFVKSPPGMVALSYAFRAMAGAAVSALSCRKRARRANLEIDRQSRSDHPIKDAAIQRRARWLRDRCQLVSQARRRDEKHCEKPTQVWIDTLTIAASAVIVFSIGISCCEVSHSRCSISSLIKRLINGTPPPSKRLPTHFSSMR